MKSDKYRLVKGGLLMPNVSVIVPVYNDENHLNRCIDSIIHQNMQDIEIRLVDDGSTDNSGRICDYYATNDDRIRVIHTDNNGVSEARNIGIANSTAQFIMFVDSDDWVEPEFCEAPFAVAMMNDADMVFFLVKIHDGKGKVQTPDIPKNEGPISENEAMLLTYYSGIEDYPYNKLYKKSLFIDIKYPKGKVYEDVGTTYKLIRSASNFYILKQHLYNYVFMRPGSITGTKSKKHLDDYFFFSFQKINNISKESTGYSELISLVSIKLALSYLIQMGFKDKYSEDSIGILTESSKIPSQMTMRNKFMFILFKINARLFDTVCVLLGKRLRD